MAISKTQILGELANLPTHLDTMDEAQLESAYEIAKLLGRRPASLKFIRPETQIRGPEPGEGSGEPAWFVVKGSGIPVLKGEGGEIRVVGPERGVVFPQHSSGPSKATLVCPYCGNTLKVTIEKQA